jgi:hypothetical protein
MQQSVGNRKDEKMETTLKIHFCQCGTCDARMVLPRKSQLGDYARLTGSPLGHPDFGDYLRKPGKWPLKFACFKCGYWAEHQHPVSRMEERQRLDADIRSKFIWLIEIKDGDPRYEDCRQTVYTVGSSHFSKHDLVQFANRVEPSLKSYRSDGEPKQIQMEDVSDLAPIIYDF